jgi:cytosine/adenosine deaminase-related metal-dependent hydrolase
VVDRLHEFGLVNQHSILAHCIHIDAAEMELIAECGSWVSHQPRSNMNNGVGAADIEAMQRMGIPVCLGNDGFSNAMWAEWKAAYLLHKVWHRDPRRAGGDLITEMAVRNNAQLAGRFFRQAPLGVIDVGAHADLILVDYQPTTPLSAGNLPWHILFGFESSMVTGTIVAGQMLMRDRALLTLDEAEISGRARELAAEVWQRYSALVPADEPAVVVENEERA